MADRLTSLDDPVVDPPRLLAARWADHLAHDRRRSPHTVRAYVATAHRFIDFLARHRGEVLGKFALLSLESTDLRAFLADRRASGLGAASAAREMSAVRAFLTFAAQDAGETAQLPRTRAPRRPRTLPRRRARRMHLPSPVTLAMPPTRRGSASATSRSCCCYMGRDCGSARRCR